MSIQISTAPCCWGVDDLSNPHLPPWRRVLSEASEAGYRGIELGPAGYLPDDEQTVAELQHRGLTVIAATIFDDLVSESNFEKVTKTCERICAFVSKQAAAQYAGDKGRPPYLVIIDFFNPERGRHAGRSEKAPRLSDEDWQRMMSHIRQLSDVARRHGVRPVVHPHAGGCIEFEDEIRRLLADIPYEVAGLCLDTGHLYYSGMEPAAWLREHADRTDYIHFKNIDRRVYDEAMHRELDFFAACAEGVMCPIGSGVIDYGAIREVLRETGYSGWITIEQERDPRKSDTSLQDVRASLAYLQGAGFH